MTELTTTKRCDWCRKEFTPWRRDQRFCSRSCDGASHRKKPAFRIINMVRSEKNPRIWGFTWQYRNHTPDCDWLFKPGAERGRGQIFCGYRQMQEREKIKAITPRNPWELPGVQIKVLIRLCFRWLAQHKDGKFQQAEAPVTQTTTPATNVIKKACPYCKTGTLTPLTNDDEGYPWKCSTCGPVAL